MDSTKRSGSHITANQKETLVDFLENNPKLNSGKFDNSFSFNNATTLWKTIAEILNSAPGAHKDWKGWRKAWYDMKANAKSKNSKLRKHQGGTGGGQHLNIDVTPLEQRILTLVGTTSVIGDEQIVETPINLESFQNVCAIVENVEVTNAADLEIINMEDVDITTDTIHIAVENNINSTEIVTKEAPIPPVKRPNRKRRVETALQYTKAATTAFENKCQKELTLKTTYYEKKIKLLERIAIAKEDTAKSIAGIAEAAVAIAIVLTGGSENTSRDNNE